MLKGLDEFVLLDISNLRKRLLETLIILPGILGFLEIREILHVEMLGIAPADDLVRPHEEGPRQEAGILLEARLEGHLLVYLELVLLHLLFHTNLKCIIDQILILIK